MKSSMNDATRNWTNPLAMKRREHTARLLPFLHNFLRIYLVNLFALCLVQSAARIYLIRRYGKLYLKLNRHGND